MVIWLGSTNKTTTNGRSILGLVLHSSEGSLDAMTRVFNTTGGASAHYAIGTDGRRYQYVRDQDIAYHVAAFGNDPRLNRNRPSWLPPYNGLYSAVNACTLGVELEGFAAQGFTPAQYAELGALIAEKGAQHGFPLTLLPDHGADARILTHGWLQTDRSDPGALFQWDTLRDALQGESMTPEQQQLLDAAASWQIPDAGTLNFMMGTRQTLAEQVASLEQLKTAAQSERDQYMAEVERLKAAGGVAVEVTGVKVALSDGREVVR